MGSDIDGKGLTNAERRIIIKNLALKEVGLLEIPDNKGRKIDEYRTEVLRKEIRGFVDPWCGYFVGYIMLKAKIDISFVSMPSRARTWFSDPKRYVYHRNRVMPIGKKPQCGDVVGYIFKSGAISHVGIIIEWNEEGGYYLSVEGNTSNSNSVNRNNNKNDGVRLKKRQISLAWVVSNVID